MSAFYMLHTNTPLNVTQVEDSIAKTSISRDTLNIDVAIPPPHGVMIIERDFHFRPTISITYYLFRGNFDEGVRAMITTVARLLTVDTSDLVLHYQIDRTMLQRLQSTLILNDTDFWRPEYRALVPLPYTVETLPDFD